jgi:hypothetical protein
MKLHSINTAQGVYVMPCGGGFSCYGFDVLDRKARGVVNWLEREAAPGDELQRVRLMLDAIGAPGTAAHFQACADVMEYGAAFNTRTGKRCGAELHPLLVGLEGRRVECERYGERVRFNVGKSTGWMPCHLAIHNARSHGGDAISVSESLARLRVIR